MSDRLSPTAKKMWSNISSAVTDAIKLARPTKLTVINNDGYKVQATRLGVTGNLDSGFIYVLRPGIPANADSGVAITLESGEIIVLGSIMDAPNGISNLGKNSIQFANYPDDPLAIELQHRYANGDIDPPDPAEIDLDQDYTYFRPKGNHAFIHAKNVHTFIRYASTGVSTTSQSAAGVLADEQQLAIPIGNWYIAAFAVAQMRTATNGASARLFLETEGQVGGLASPNLRADVDAGVAASIQIASPVGGGTRTFQAKFYTANGSNTTVDSITWIFVVTSVEPGGTPP